ncbi:hypothetical protein [Marinobacter sp.]|uniref:hypothetical protein n=1 Tax=Marinobacter sp. TaxID=50741 RepID=UPI00384B4D04
MNRFNPFNGRPLLGFGTSLFAAIVLSGCGGSSSSDSTTPLADSSSVGVIATASSDFESGAVELVDLNASDLTATGGFFATLSDIAVVGGEQHYYRLGRFGIDTVQKVDVENPAIEEWQYSTLVAGEEGSGNPQDLVIASPTKAYLLRYDKSEALIVNPSATRQEDFVTGELDLSAYTPANGNLPGMVKGLIVEGKLFVAMQRLDSDFNPSNDSYVAVFNITNDKELETGQGTGDIKGIPLVGRNPGTVTYHPQLGIVVQSVGQYFPQKFTGGIDTIDPETFAVKQLVDDTEETGQISGLAIASETQGYFISYAGWLNTSIVPFDPSTGDVSEAVNQLSGGDFRAIDVSPAGNLWVADANASAPGVRVIDTADNSQIHFIRTDLLPNGFAFVTNGN